MKFYNPVEKLPSKVEVSFGFGFKAMTIDFPFARLNDTTVKFTKNGGALGIDITSAKPIGYVKITWDTPDYDKDAFILGDAFERDYNALYWEKQRAGRICFWYMATSNKTDTNAYGVMTGARSFCSWIPSSGNLTLKIDVRNGSFPVKLGSRTLHACDVVCTQSEKAETPFKTLQRFCKIMCPAPKLAKNPVYGTNSWYYIFNAVTQDDIVRDADLLEECTKGLSNRPFCVIDDGWQTLHMESYRFSKLIPWGINENKFPDMDGLVEYIKSKDLLPGIWIRPLLASLGFDRKMRQSAISSLFDVNVLDPSHPDTLKYVANLMKGLVARGFKLIKHDFSTRDILGMYHFELTYKSVCRPLKRFHDKTRTTAEIILDLYRTIRDAVGDDIVIIGCNTVSHLSAGIFEVQRIGDDTSPVNWTRNKRNGINSLAFRMCQHNTFYACDADCIGYTNEIPWSKDREWLNLLAVSGTPLFTSVTPALATPEIKADLKKAFALASTQSEVAVPLDWFDTKYPCHWRTETTCQVHDFDLE